MKEPLSKTNPYLKDPKEREYWLKVTVYSSSKIEGIKVPKIKKMEKEKIA